MDKVFYKSLLYDFYGELLTQKQRDIYELYYHNDLSLGEISQREGVTPQAVSDILRRSEKALKNYEDKLKAAENYRIKQKTGEELFELLEKLTGQEDLILQIKEKISILTE